MCSNILNKQPTKQSMPKMQIVISYIALQTHHVFWNVYWNIEVSTYPQNGDIIVVVVWVVIPVIKTSPHLVNCSAKIVVSGASSNCEIVSTHPKYGKIFNLSLCVVLPYRNISSSLESLEKIYYIYIYININICIYKYINVE